MLKKDRWLLPEGVREIMSPEARAIEMSRRKILDMYHGCGYDLVQPPFIDFYDSLLTGMGHDLELMTFTLTDQLSGKLLGIRSDMTPQVSRIDAHYIKDHHPSRLCYLGEVLQSRLDDFSQSRCPLQAGAEIYGHDGIESDIEIIQLMIKTIRAVGVDSLTLDLGHVGIFRCLSEQAELSDFDREQLFEAFQRKAITEIKAFLAQLNLAQEYQDAFINLVNLHGSIDILAKAREQLNYPDIIKHIDLLEQAANKLQQLTPNVKLFFDLSELRGFNYHTGIVFSAYIEGHGQAIAQGGRYDGIGEKFGRARSATGFSTDLAHLVEITGFHQNSQDWEQLKAIFAPAVDEGNESLCLAIEKLRAEGERVICELKGQTVDYDKMNCNRRLVCKNKVWLVESI
ncbi:MAG: ATP phosphoribosyltransferase regulatory subunit [Gammaproteobacteria bacterium]|nr:ATP phosphoribosyltransferase regulatory subunit [Gammaproteobacteria bacterium]